MADDDWKDDLAAIRRAIAPEEDSSPSGEPWAEKVRFVHVLIWLGIGIASMLIMRAILGMPDTPDTEGLKWFAGNVLPMGMLAGYFGAVVSVVFWLLNLGTR